MKDKHNEPKNDHWVLVADASRAQLFETDATLETFTPVEAHTHPESRLPISELVDGDRGATREMAGGPQSRFERHTDPHRATLDAFARELADVVNTGRIAHQFEHVIIVAPPTFLGALRSHLDSESTRRVKTSIAHDWTAVPVNELPARVRGGMPEVAPD